MNRLLNQLLYIRFMKCVRCVIIVQIYHRQHNACNHSHHENQVYQLLNLFVMDYILYQRVTQTDQAILNTRSMQNVVNMIYCCAAQWHVFLLPSLPILSQHKLVAKSSDRQSNVCGAIIKYILLKFVVYAKPVCRYDL